MSEIHKIELTEECVKSEDNVMSGGYTESVVMVTGNTKTGSCRAEIKLRSLRSLGIIEDDVVKITVEKVNL